MKLEKVVTEIIQNNKIKTQGELVKKLEKSNISVTQSNLSRILKKIHAVKFLDKNGQFYYAIQAQPLELDGWIHNLIYKIEDNNCNIVIKTYSGAAEVVAKLIDQKDIENILATIAGDDVVLIVPKNIRHINEIKEDLKNLLM